MNKNAKNRFREVADLQNIMDSEIGLWWLADRYGGGALTQYKWVDAEIKKRESRMAKALSVIKLCFLFTTLSGLGGGLTLAVLNSATSTNHHYNSNCIFSISFVLVVSAIIFAIMTDHFIDALHTEWSEQMDAWIETKWTTAEFFDDVRRLATIMGSADKDYFSSHIHLLTGNGLEAVEEAVPSHVKDECIRWLNEQIMEILKKPSVLPEAVKNEKKQAVKSAFDLFKRYEIVSEDERLDTQYRTAEYQLGLAALKRQP